MEWGRWERPTFANGTKDLLSHSVATVHVQMATPPTVNLTSTILNMDL